MSNLAGVLVIVAGLFFVIVGIKGTQHAALPGLFPVASSSSGGVAQLGPNPPNGPTNSGSSAVGAGIL